MKQVNTTDSGGKMSFTGEVEANEGFIRQPPKQAIGFGDAHDLVVCSQNGRVYVMRYVKLYFQSAVWPSGQ